MLYTIFVLMHTKKPYTERGFYMKVHDIK